MVCLYGFIDNSDKHEDKRTSCYDVISIDKWETRLLGFILGIICDVNHAIVAGYMQLQVARCRRFFNDTMA